MIQARVIAGGCMFSLMALAVSLYLMYGDSVAQLPRTSVQPVQPPSRATRPSRAVASNWEAVQRTAEHRRRGAATSSSSGQQMPRGTTTTVVTDPARITAAPTTTKANKDGLTYPDVLFVVYTDSMFFATRVLYILSTWGSELAPQSLLMVGDKEGSLLGYNVMQSNCPKHRHSGACCKVGVSLYRAYEKVIKNRLSWAYFTDDDAYVVVKHIVAGLRSKKKHAKTMLGIFGCAVRNVCAGLCGGGGFAMSREALEAMVGHPKPMAFQAFIDEFDSYCVRCDMWGDQAVSAMAQQRRISQVEWPGLHGWLMKKRDFTQDLGVSQRVPVIGRPWLTDREPEPQLPLMYHYIREEAQFRFLHRLFGPSKDGTCPGEDGKGPCIQWGKRRCCARSASPLDIPWDSNSRRLLAPRSLRPLAAGGNAGARRACGTADTQAEVAACAAERAGLTGPWPLEALVERFGPLGRSADAAVVPGILDDGRPTGP